jgi:hypothetical protein
MCGACMSLHQNCPAFWNRPLRMIVVPCSKTQSVTCNNGNPSKILDEVGPCMSCHAFCPIAVDLFVWPSPQTSMRYHIVAFNGSLSRTSLVGVWSQFHRGKSATVPSGEDRSEWPQMEGRITRNTAFIESIGMHVRTLSYNKHRLQSHEVYNYVWIRVKYAPRDKCDSLFPRSVLRIGLLASEWNSVASVVGSATLVPKSGAFDWMRQQPMQQSRSLNDSTLCESCCSFLHIRIGVQPLRQLISDGGGLFRPCNVARLVIRGSSLPILSESYISSTNLEMSYHSKYIWKSVLQSWVNDGSQQIAEGEWPLRLTPTSS